MPRRTQVLPRSLSVSDTGLSPSMVRLSSLLLLPSHESFAEVLQPQMLESTWFGLFPFRSPLLRESRLISSPAGTEMFHFPALAPANLFIQSAGYGTAPVGLPHSDTPGSMCVWPLPGAFRSLPRLSSPISAKASACCPYLLALLRLLSLLPPI